MNVENPLVPVTAKPDMPDLLMQQDMGVEEPPPPLRKIMLAMRGRWRMATILAVILGVTFGAVGYLVLTKPLYRSTGIIRVDPNLDRLIFNTENQALKSYDSFVGSQVALISAPRIVELALAHESWTSLNRPNSAAEAAKFYKALTVDHPRNTELIYVYFQDTDRTAAQAGAKAVVDSYFAVYVEGELKKASEKIEMIQSRVSKLREDQKRLRDNRTAITNEAGVDDLKTRQIQLQEELRSYESRLNELLIMIQLMPASPADDPAKAPAGAAPGAPNPAGAAPDKAAAAPPVKPEMELTPENIAAFDPKMRDYLTQRENIEREISQQSLTLGPDHRNVQYAKKLLATIDRQIELRVQTVRDQISKGQIQMTPPSGTNGVGQLTAKDLKARYLATQAMYEETNRKLREINAKQQQYQAIVDQEDTVVENLKATIKRLDEVTTEPQTASRVKVLSPSDVPLEPIKDSRKVLAMAGAVGGILLGFAFMLLVGLSDRRIRNVDEAEDSFNDVQMLGVLPTLPEDLSAPDQAAIAAHCVHQIRTLLQISSDSQGRRVFATTSALRGDGKTSLSLALGLSFATSEAKTLLIDCDLAGSGLTRRVDAIIRRKVGEILQRKQLVTAQQVDHALQLSQESGRRLGETLIELGYVDQAALEEALSLQEHTPVGLLDALAGEPLEHCVAPSGVENLWILGVGAADGNHVARMSPMALRRVLDECRREFDIVVIDTGPIPGSLEASHVAAEADGVLLVVSRNEERGQVEKALEHLLAIGAPVSGIVFNRADGRDVQALAYSSMVSQWPHDRPPSPPNPTKESARFGPVARAVASTVPPSASRTNQ